MPSSIQVLLVSAQAAPNLLPALDPELKPERAILLVSKKMEDRARALQKVLGEAGVRTQIEPVEDEHSFEQLENTLLKLAEQFSGQSIALNVTGGTKLMALAAQSVAQAYHWPVFYVDLDTDEVIWLGKESRSKPLQATLRLRHYLLGYGFQIEGGIERPQLDRARQQLTQTLIKDIGSLEEPIGQLNWLAQQAEDKHRLDTFLTETQQDSRKLEALLRHFEEAGVLRSNGSTIQFPTEQDRDFTKGGWLEHHVYGVLGSLGHGIRDKAANLVVIDNKGVRNELDVAFMARNRLFVIECKTARMDGERALKANDTLFKLSEICRRVGGLGTRGVLASYRKMGDSERKLATALGLKVICGPELMRLEEQLRNWLK